MSKQSTPTVATTPAAATTTVPTPAIKTAPVSNDVASEIKAEHAANLDMFKADLAKLITNIKTDTKADLAAGEKQIVDAIEWMKAHL
jgi:hypothetical protein